MFIDALVKLSELLIIFALMILGCIAIVGLARFFIKGMLNKN